MSAGRAPNTILKGFQTAASDSQTTNKYAPVRRDLTRLKILHDNLYEDISATMGYYTRGDFIGFMENEPNMLSYTEYNNTNRNFYLGDNGNESTNDIYSLNNLIDVTALGKEDLTSKYRTITNKVIDNLRQGMKEYQLRVNLQEENNQLRTFQDILENRDRLIEYLEQQKRENNMFEVETTLTQDPVLKPWIQEYFIRHGPPNDGVFESEKLGNIITELRNAGVITDDDIVNTGIY